MIYFDNNATSEPLPSVRGAMLEHLAIHWGNPSSAHVFGLHAKTEISIARRRVSDLVGTEPETILFTSSATEANNTALLSAIRASPEKRRIVTAATEHSAVISMGRAQESAGYEMVLIPPIASGVVDLQALTAAIDANTAVVSIMWANNETGVINPVETVAALCRRRNVLFHCDAAQAAGKVHIDLRSTPIDYLTLSGHKFHGPKGVGALVIGAGVPFTSMLYGGLQENGRRGGTENVPAIVGFGVAALTAASEMVDRSEHTAALRGRLESRLLEEVSGATINGFGAPRLPNTTNIGFSDVDSDTLVALLDQRGVCVSSGSACLSDAVAPSHVILAMTGSHKKASEAVRFSVSHFNTVSEIDYAVDAVKEAVAALR